MQPLENFTDAEAAAVVAQDRESAQRDLVDNIDRGNFPKWNFRIQVMTGSGSGARIASIRSMSRRCGRTRIIR